MMQQIQRKEDGFGGPLSSWTDSSSMFSDPSGDSILPIDDDLWNQDVQSHAPLLSSPPTETMGRYCLTAQSAILLGRVFRNIHDYSNIDGLRDQEAKALESALIALTNVSLQEGRSRGIVLCSPTTICFSARLLLHDKERHPTRTDTDTISRTNFQHVSSDIAEYMRSLSMALLSKGCRLAEEASPLCLEAMYRSGIVYARRYSETSDPGDLDAFETIKIGLQVMGVRWRLAASYIEMLDA
ncbi:hypothetical protein FSARC_8492, partial [Fusarium sarcochroum]